MLNKDVLNKEISPLSFQSVFVDDPFSRKNDTPALPPKKGVPPRPKPPSGNAHTPAVHREGDATDYDHLKTGVSKSNGQRAK